MLILIVALCFASPSSCCDDNVWRGIQPLKTSRHEVKKLLGPPTADSVSPYASKYLTHDGDVSITFSRGGCDSELNSGWNVPELTVLQIAFYPSPKIPIADLRFDRDKFNARSDSDIIDLLEYVNREDGISITVDTDLQLVESVIYSPNNADRYLLCKCEVESETRPAY